MLTTRRLHEVLDYNAKTGVFRWRIPTGTRVHAGMIAGCVTGRGYRYIKIDGPSYRASRLAWLYVTGKWPRKQMDHRNGVTSDDRFSNLRDVSGSENCQNQRNPQRKGKIYPLGVSAYNGKFRAAITYRGISRWLGVFKTVAEAHAAYMKAKRIYHPGACLE